jgi:hypothetical protein
LCAPEILTGSNKPHLFVGSIDGFLINGSFTPVVSLQAAFASNPDVLSTAFGTGVRHFVIAAGIDWLGRDGINVGGGIHLPVNEPIGGPYVYLGWNSDLI